MKKLLRKWLGCNCKEEDYPLHSPTEMTYPQIELTDRKVIVLRSEEEYEEWQLKRLPETLIRRTVENNILEEVRKHIDVEIMGHHYPGTIRVNGSLRVIDK